MMRPTAGPLIHRRSLAHPHPAETEFAFRPMSLCPFYRRQLSVILLANGASEADQHRSAPRWRQPLGWLFAAHAALFILSKALVRVIIDHNHREPGKSRLR